MISVIHGAIANQLVVPESSPFHWCDAEGVGFLEVWWRRPREVALPVLQYRPSKVSLAVEVGSKLLSFAGKKTP